jgi:hypothetical protein
VADFKKYVKEKLGGWSYFEEANKPVWNWLKHSPAVHDLGFVIEEEKEETPKIITKISKEEEKEAKRKFDEEILGKG